MTDRVVLLPAVEQAELVLERHEGRQALRGGRAAAASVRAPSKFEQPISRTLPARDQLGHRAERVLDGHVVVGPVDLVQVDAVGAQPASDASQADRTTSGWAPSMAPNFVATTTSSRRGPSARPRNSSLKVPP